MNLRRQLTPKLEIGDSVRVLEIDPNTDQKQFTANKIGIISDIFDVPKSIQKWYQLSFDNGWIGYYTRTQIEFHKSKEYTCKTL